MAPSLYGIVHSNRNFDDSHYWGKNQFNSAFPASLSCYMRDKAIPAVRIGLDANLNTVISETPFEEIFGTNLPNSELYFAFESIYEPFRAFVEDQLASIDLVIKDVSGAYIRPLEIKLTTLPDNTTCNLAEDRWGCEIVLRSATLKYMALSIAESCGLPADKARIRDLFAFCGRIRGWENEVEALTYFPQIVSALESFFAEFCDRQRPLLLQPIWKTQRKTPILADNCLDIFVWTDFALFALGLSSAKTFDETTLAQAKIICYRMSRFLCEWASNDKIFLGPIFDTAYVDDLGESEFRVTNREFESVFSGSKLREPVVHKGDFSNIVEKNEFLRVNWHPTWDFYYILNVEKVMLGH